jgi:hypothetical protein
LTEASSAPPRRVHPDESDNPGVTNSSEATEPKTSPRRSRRGLMIAVGVVVAAAIAVAVLFLTGVIGGRGGGSTVAREVSVPQLRAYADSSATPVYWAGPIPGRRLELTETDDGNVFVRYLTADAVVADARPAFTTVGSYPFADAAAEVRRRSDAPGMQSAQAPRGGLATWSRERPSSVYLGFAGTDVLVEVYDPSPKRARELALSGRVVRVR